MRCCVPPWPWSGMQAQAPYTAFTLVNQTVEAARACGLERQAGFINACLRRFLREQPALVAATDSGFGGRWNHPRWWIDQFDKSSFRRIGNNSAC